MRTLPQIYKKADSLQRELRLKAELRGVYENFGDKEEKTLQNYVGGVYDYDYFTRLTVEKILSAFFDWRTGFTG